MTKVHDILTRCRRPFAVSNALAQLYIHCIDKLRSRRKQVVLGPRFVGGKDTPDYGHTFSNRTNFRACGRFWLSSVQRALGVADENRRRQKIEESRQHLSMSTGRGGVTS